LKFQFVQTKRRFIDRFFAFVLFIFEQFKNPLVLQRTYNIFVTHNSDIAFYCERNIVLRDGRIIVDTYNPKMLSAAEALERLPKEEKES